MSSSADNSSLFQRLKAGLAEGIRFARGELNLRTTELPDRPPELRAKDILRLRRKLNMSQGVFARLINVSAKTVQSWEQGERKPSQAALRLLQIMEARPKLVCQIVGIRLERRAKQKVTAGASVKRSEAIQPKSV